MPLPLAVVSSGVSSLHRWLTRHPWWVAASMAVGLHLAFAALPYKGGLIQSPPPPMQEISVTLLPVAPATTPEPPKPQAQPRHQPKPQPPKVQKPVEPVKPAPQPVPTPPVKQEVMASNAKPVANAPIVDNKPAPVAENKAAHDAPPPAPAPVIAPRFDAAYLSNPAPVYPPLSRRMEEEGKVVLRVHVTPEGTASEVQLAKSSGFPRLDEAAQNAVRRWRFVPARQGDKAVAAWVNVPLAFKLDD